MSEYTKAIYEAIADAAGEMKAIPKNQRNQQQNFDFRSIESIVGHAKPLLTKHSLAIVPSGFDVLHTEQVQSNSGTRGWRTVVNGHWIIGHADGSQVAASMVGEAVDYGDKSASKAVQMAYKYMLTQLLGIGSEDPDGLSPEIAAPTDPTEPMPKATNRLKADLFTQLDGDGDLAAEIYSAAAEALGVSDDEPLPADKLEAMQVEVDTRATEAMGETPQP